MKRCTESISLLIEVTVFEKSVFLFFCLCQGILLSIKPQPFLQFVFHLWKLTDFSSFQSLLTVNILLKNTHIQTIFSNRSKQVSYTYSTSGPCTLVTVLSVFVQFNYNDKDGLLDYILTVSFLILHNYVFTLLSYYNCHPNWVIKSFNYLAYFSSLLFSIFFCPARFLF